MYKVGLLELEARAIQATCISPCFHAEATIGIEFSVPGGRRIVSSSFDLVPVQEESPELMVVTLSAGSSPARWFCFLHAMNDSHRDWTPQRQLLPGSIYIRDKDCCSDCCFESENKSKQDRSTTHELGSLLAVIIL
jgi:hypothetical protein